MFRNQVFFSFFLIFCGCLAISVPAHAKEDLLARFKKPMPEVEPMPEKDFLDQTEVFEQRPTGDKALAYNIRIPSDWTKAEDAASSNFQISDKLLTQVAIFYGPPSIYGQERLEIKAVTLEFDMNAEQWFLINLMTRGLTTEGYKAHDQRRVEAMLLIMEKDVSYVLRTIVQINGKRVILVEHYVPVDLWDQRAGLQEKLLSSFKLINPIHLSVVKLEPYQMLDIAQINYPDIWQESPDSLTSVERLGVKFLNYTKFEGNKYDFKNTNPNLEGVIDVLLVATWSTPSLLDEIETFKKTSEINDLLIGERIDLIDDVTYHDTVGFGVVEAYKVLNNKDNLMEYEFWLSVLVSGNYYYFMSLMTPSRNDNYKLWVTNTQSFKLLVANTKPAPLPKQY